MVLHYWIPQKEKMSRGLIEADSGTTLNLSNVSFRDFKFGYTLAGSGYGAIYAVNATIACKMLLCQIV